MGLRETIKAGNQETEELGKDLAVKRQNIQEYKRGTSPPSLSARPKTGGTFKIDRINKGSKAKYGSRPGEKRIDVRDMLKPLKKGTAKVKKTGPRVVHKGEAVLTAKQAKKLRKQGKLRGKKVRLNQMQKLGRMAPRKVHAPVKRQKKGRGKRA